MTATQTLATQAELDTTAYDAYVRNGENKAAAGRELGLNASTVADRIKRHLARREQDTLADSLALDAEQAAQDAEYAADSEAAEQVTEAVFAVDRPATEDPDESLVALLEDGEPDQPDSDVIAQPGPGQAEDNIVHAMVCGHEYDSPVELAPGQAVQCSAHGQTEIAGEQEPEAALAAKAGYEGAVCPECDAIAYAYKGGHFTDCRYHKLNAAAAGHVAGPAPAAEGAPEPDTEDDPQAQAERDALMSQACGTCGVEVDYDGGPVEHLDDCPDAPAAEDYTVGITVNDTVVAMTRRADITGQDDEAEVAVPPAAKVMPEPAPAGDALRKLHETVYPEKQAATLTAEATPEPAPAKAGRFPEGVVTPNEFRGALVAEGIVPEKTVHYLGYKLANENSGFPARWYAKDGTSHDYDARKPGARLGIHLADGREWVKNPPAKPARQPRTPKAKVVLFEGGKPSARLAELLGSGGGGQAELTSADVSALYAAYASMTAAGGTLRGFAGWLGEIG